MMICITGDVHHASLGTGDQACSDIDEAESARLYTAVCEEYGVRPTLYFTGRIFEEEWDRLSSWLDPSKLEIGGHTYDAFEPALLHRIWRKLTGNYNGPRWYERRQIRKTVEAVEERCGVRIRSWRNHAYFHGPNTAALLAAEGLLSCSDFVTAPGVSPFRDEHGLWHFPINVIPDHEHLYHGERTPREVARWVRRYVWRDAYGPLSFDAETWRRMVLDHIEYNEARGVTSTILLHPLCMYLLDRFETLRAILEAASRYETCTITEAVEHERKKQEAAEGRES